MSSPFNKRVIMPLQVLWIAVRALLIASYTGAIALLSAVALPELGLVSDLATVYVPGLFATLLALAGVHYLFGPELGRLRRSRAL